MLPARSEKALLGQKVTASQGALFKSSCSTQDSLLKASSIPATRQHIMTALQTEEESTVSSHVRKSPTLSGRARGDFLGTTAQLISLCLQRIPFTHLCGPRFLFYWEM